MRFTENALWIFQSLPGALARQPKKCPAIDKSAMSGFATTSFIGCVVCILSLSNIYQRKTTPRIRSRVSAVTVWFLGMAAWPLIWSYFLKSRRKDIKTLPGLLWPLVILMIDIRAMNHTTYESNTQSKRSIMTMDANAMCSLTFALSGILGAQNDNCCRDIFMYAIIGCIAFVLPAPHTSNSSTETVMIESVQKTMLAYATGLLLTGIMLMLSKREKLTSG